MKDYLIVELMLEMSATKKRKCRHKENEASTEYNLWKFHMKKEVQTWMSSFTHSSDLVGMARMAQLNGV
jgi:hypothetical protein